MSIEIKEGKFYKTRMGKKIGPMQWYAGKLFNGGFGNEGMWDSSGKFIWALGSNQYFMDLTEEWSGVEIESYEYRRFLDPIGNVTQCDPTGLRPMITVRFNTVDDDIDLSSYRLSKD